VPHTNRCLRRARRVLLFQLLRRGLTVGLSDPPADVAAAQGAGIPPGVARRRTPPGYPRRGRRARRSCAGVEPSGATRDSVSHGADNGGNRPSIDPQRQAWGSALTSSVTGSAPCARPRRHLPATSAGERNETGRRLRVLKWAIRLSRLSSIWHQRVVHVSVVRAVRWHDRASRNPSASGAGEAVVVGLQMPIRAVCRQPRAGPRNAEHLAREVRRKFVAPGTDQFASGTVSRDLCLLPSPRPVSTGSDPGSGAHPSPQVTFLIS
jgi:hypothetical protein